MQTSRVRSLAELFDDLDLIDKSINIQANKVSNKHRELELLCSQAEWHIRGMTYHARTLMHKYGLLIQQVSTRVEAIPELGAAWMYTPESQELIFEFYALVNLSRIALDHLRHLLSKLFKTPFNNLPKSITGYKAGTTDCPICERISNDPVIAYLIDLRNCLVHYRTFATKDNTVATREGFDELEDPEGFLRSSFRVDEQSRLVFNIYLPDEIFVMSGNNKTLAKFTYNNGNNLLGESVRFIKHIFYSYFELFNEISEDFTPRYSFSSGGFSFRVPYKPFVG